MPTDKGHQQREENPHQGFATETRKEGSTERGDQERTIQTGRDDIRSTGVSRRSPASVYRSDASTLSPFSLMRRMAEDMDRMFDNFSLGRSAFGTLPTFGSNRDLWRGSSNLTDWAPEVETFRRDNKLVVRADLPGLKKDDVNVEVDNGVLTISGERRDEREEERDDYYRSERSYGQFYRAIPLPEGIDDNQCDASFKDGVLEITFPVPKPEDRKAKRIPVK
jgi:HSP20 family protein